MQGQQTMASWIWLTASNKVLWNTAMPICLCIIYGCFCCVMAGLRSWDKNYISTNLTYLLSESLRKVYPIPELECWFCWERWGLRPIWISCSFSDCTFSAIPTTQPGRSAPTSTPFNHSSYLGCNSIPPWMLDQKKMNQYIRVLWVSLYFQIRWKLNKMIDWHKNLRVNLFQIMLGELHPLPITFSFSEVEKVLYLFICFNE